MDTDEDWSAAGAALLARLERLAHRREAEDALLPWIDRLSEREQEWLRNDLSVVLAEPEATGEPVDWREIGEILREWAEVAGWDGVLVRPDRSVGAGTFRVDLRDADAEALTRASAAVQTAMERLLAEFLPFYPTASQLLSRGRLKKLKNRDVWQIQLPDGYRLRYVVDKLSQVVHVVYFGPHPDRETRDRERAARTEVKRQRYRSD
jgi:hypothetical protein